MATRRPRAYTLSHKDGTIWARGQHTGKVMTGRWVWFRKDGSKMRSGSFTVTGERTGKWTTYDRTGRIMKVTVIRPDKKGAK